MTEEVQQEYDAGAIEVLQSPRIFPTLEGTHWRRVDLDALARHDYPQARGVNPLNNPAFCEAWVDSHARRLGGLTFGGYAEDRSHLWRGHYHTPGLMRHLGVDYNVPSGTAVSVPMGCTVIRTVKDPDQAGGWGGLVFFKLDRPYRGAQYLIYGHLEHKSLPAEDAVFAKGAVVARVGDAIENGGWFPHLHVQCFNQAVFERFTPDLEQIDGYGPLGRREFPEMPDPIDLCTGMIYGDRPNHMIGS